MLFSLADKFKYTEYCYIFGGGICYIKWAYLSNQNVQFNRHNLQIVTLSIKKWPKKKREIRFNWIPTTNISQNTLAKMCSVLFC